MRNYPRQFRAGVFGPDAYPDIMTGQQAIHPDDSPGGTNAWLEHLWANAAPGSANQAFVMGFLAHGAGDMYAHTFVNHFAGGDFTIGTNALKHIVLEGYLGKRAPDCNFDVSIDGGVDTFIYNTLVNATPGSTLATKLLVGQGTAASVPYIFSKMRAQLQQDIVNYYNMATEDKVFYSATHPGWITYKEHWVQDIDSGLKAWPRFSHNIALAVFRPQGADIDTAKRLANDYVNQHLLSMLGAPDFVGVTRAAIQQISDAILNAVANIPGLREIRALIADLKKSLLDYVLKQTLGMTSDELKAYFTNPEQYIDRVIGPGSVNGNGNLAPGTKMSLAALNSGELKLNDRGYTNPGERWNWQRFAPAYNTVTMIKLSMLSTSEMNRLLHDLGSTMTMTRPNVMLGYDRKFDGSNQWQVNPAKMILVHAGVYDQLFMKQTGETPLPPKTPPAVIEDPNVTITITVNRVHALDNIDGPFGNADFYPVIRIAGEEFTTGYIGDKNDISPNWTFRKTVKRSAGTVPITIDIWDSDGGLRGSDDHADINPANGRTLSLTYNIANGSVTGSVSGRAGQQIYAKGNESDKAEIWFTITAN